MERKIKTLSLKKDQYGYVNGRGKSKYWGVTTAPSAHGKDIWIVSVQDYTGTTKTIRSKGFVLQELDAAIIAAHFYEVIKSGRPFNKFTVKSHCGKYVLTVHPHLNYVVKDTVAVQSTIFDNVELDMKPREVEIPQPVKVSDQPVSYVALVKMITSAQLSNEQIDSLQALLNLKVK
jgi:hypothetical protein